MSLKLQCLRIRMIEEHIALAYPTDKIQSPVHLSNGQEAISVGVCAALEKTDLVFGTYRGHALYLAKGGSLKRMMAELYGKRNGCGGGKAGSMHLSEKEVGVMGASAIVAATIPHAVGAAYAAKFRKINQVVVCFFGDGATTEGVYHESLNFATKHRLPLLFVCENNGLAIYTREKDVTAYRVVEHAKSYGVSAQFCANGADVEQVYKLAQAQIDSIRAGSGPQLVECKTFRYKQHVGPNDENVDESSEQGQEYRLWKDKDPLALISVAESDICKIKQEIQDAMDYAESGLFPSAEDLYSDVY